MKKLRILIFIIIPLFSYSQKANLSKTWNIKYIEYLKMFPVRNWCPINQHDSTLINYGTFDSVAYLQYSTPERIKKIQENYNKQYKEAKHYGKIKQIVDVKLMEKRNGVLWYLEDNIDTNNISKDYIIDVSIIFVINCRGELSDIGFFESTAGRFNLINEFEAMNYLKFIDNIVSAFKKMPLFVPAYVKGKPVNVGRYRADFRYSNSGLKISIPANLSHRK